MSVAPASNKSVAAMKMLMRDQWLNDVPDDLRSVTDLVIQRLGLWRDAGEQAARGSAAEFMATFYELVESYVVACEKLFPVDHEFLAIANVAKWRDVREGNHHLLVNKQIHSWLYGTFKAVVWAEGVHLQQISDADGNVFLRAGEDIQSSVQLGCIMQVAARCAGLIFGEWIPTKREMRALQCKAKSLPYPTAQEERELEIQLMQELRRAYDRRILMAQVAPQSRTKADTKADKKIKKQPRIPRSAELQTFIRRLQREPSQHGNLMAIALEITNGDERKAKNLLRQERRYRQPCGADGGIA